MSKSQKRRGRWGLWSLCSVLGLLCAWGFVEIEASAKDKDDDMILLPSPGQVRTRPKPPPRASVARQVLKPIHGPAKEWQTFRSTAEITCAVRYKHWLWAGTKSTALIRWNLRTGGYTFYKPRVGGVASRQINALAVQSNGDLWIATNNGLALLKRGRERWKFFRRKDGLPSTKVRGVVWTPAGKVWIATDQGVALRDGAFWRIFTSKQGLPSDDIRTISVDHRGRVWFSPTIANPFYHDGKRFRAIKRFPVVGASCIVPDRRGGMWFCSERGAVFLKVGPKADVLKIKFYNTSHGLAGLHVQSILVDQQGGVWMGTRSRGISYFAKGRWRTINRSQGLADLDVRMLIQNAAGKIYAATHLGGVWKQQGTRWHALRVGVAGNQVRAIAYAPNGAIWLGTSSGASRYYQGYWTNFTTGLPNRDIRAFTFDPEGNVWAGTNGGGVVRFDGRRWKTFEILDGLRSNRVVGAGLTPEGLWFLHPLKGISLRQGNTWKTFHKGNTGQVLNDIHQMSTLFIDSQLRPWAVSNGGGVAHFAQGQVWKALKKMRGAQRGAIADMAEDSKGRLWFATRYGLFRYHKGRIKRYTRNQGLPDNQVLTVATEGEKVWVGTRAGAACFDGTSWRSFNKNTGLASNHIQTILVTPWGQKWFGSAYSGVTLYHGR